ncbi:MAG: GIY-YIG nuclease family protein [Pedobacter sp.]|nr:MAG: GIY-YIG nuclease family protein [Pedobacter sp.]
MVHYVYIIRSLSSGIFYRGYSLDPIARLEQHNEGLSSYTSGKGPWELVYIEAFEDKKPALVRERSLKKYSRAQLQIVITSDKNIVERFGKG